MGIDVMAFCLGAVLLLVGLLGGGFELKEVKFPSVGKTLRLITVVIGAFFISLGIGLSFRDRLIGGNTAPDIALKNTYAPPPVASATIASLPPQQLQPSAPTPTDDHKPTLISAIRLADYAEIEAGQSLDPTPLYNCYSGEALRMAIANIEALKARGQTQLSVLEEQDFRSFKLSPDGMTAEVRVIETWETTYYDAVSHECAGKIPSHKVPQTIHLKRGNEGWLVTAILHDLQTPDIVPCD